MPISRQQFLTLTGLDVDSHTALKRRDQIPLMNQVERHYTGFEALLCNISERIASSPDGHGAARTLATNIVRDVMQMIAQRADDITRTAESFRREEGFEVILAGRMLTSSGPVPFCGTKAEVAQAIASVDLLDLMLTNVTGALVVLQLRAQRAEIDLSDMWPAPDTLPSYEERQEAIKARWAEVVRRGRGESFDVPTLEMIRQREALNQSN